MIIVFSGLKGGTGKSTLAFHIAVKAFLENFEIVTYDLDSPQFSFSIYYRNRLNNLDLKTWKKHFQISDLSKIGNFDQDKLIIIDTQGSYNPQLLEVHKKADIIITPVNDSFIDLNTIMTIEKERWSTFGNYYEFIYNSRNFNENLQWFIIRNRSSPIVSKLSKDIKIKLLELSKKINFKLLDGPKDRNVYKELFNRGSTVLDLKSKLSISNIAAKFEIMNIWKELSSFINSNIKKID